MVVKFRNHNISWLSNVGIMTTLLASNPVFFLSLHFVFMVIILLFTWLFIVFSVSIHVIDSSTACWNPQRAVCDICHCLLGATPCFPRLTSALPDGSRDTRRAAQDGNTGFSSWGACSLGEMRRGILSLSLFAVGRCMSAGFEVTTQAWWGRTHGDRLLFLLQGSKTTFLKCVWKRERAVEERAC